MGFLTGLRSMDFLEQFQILNEIETDKKFAAIPELFEYYANPLGDKAVDYVVKTTLSKLLAQDENSVRQGMESEFESVRKICVRLAGEAGFVSCGPRLLELEAQTTDTEFLYEVLEALSRLALPEFLPVFRRQATNPEALIAALALDMIAQYRDEESVPRLKEIVDTGEDDAHYEVCEWPTWKAIEALAAIGTAPSLAYLASKLHHRNPTARRIIHENLIKVGAPALPYIAAGLKSGIDNAIMAANVIGFIRDRKGSDALLEALEFPEAQHVNVRFAIFEALGRIPSMKSAVALTDALTEHDPLVLMAVMTGIERQMNPGVVKKIKDLVASERGREIAQAVIAAKAITVFVFLYADENIGNQLMDVLMTSADPEAVTVFRDKLSMMDSPRAKADLARLSNRTTSQDGAKILAVDDSEAMLNFYRNVVTSWGCHLTTAGNGREALDMIEMGYPFDLVLADMNMPVMDGIELTRKIREKPTTAALPVVMITTETEGSQADLARKAGVSAFMKKPFKPDELKAKAQEYLTGKM